MPPVGQLARDHWRGAWNGDGHAPEGEQPDGYRDYDRKVPLLATTLKLLAAHGPHVPVGWRYGHSTWQSLDDALDNPDDFRAYSVRAEARRKAREAELERARREREEERHRMEAAQWVCPGCRSSVYPDAGLTASGECSPCLSDRRRAAEAAQEQTGQAPGGGIFGWRRRA
ncbi:hypothetical protein ACFUIT_39950 [Streptomyces sp. NPDC057239]|uniref:hypothetical protein n=1 Tax=Streptomyces sp. NPDC057239 TaxID=3346061 RepID=UPI003643ED78